MTISGRNLESKSTNQWILSIPDRTTRWRLGTALALHRPWPLVKKKRERRLLNTIRNVCAGFYRVILAVITAYILPFQHTTLRREDITLYANCLQMYKELHEKENELKK